MIDRSEYCFKAGCYCIVMPANLVKYPEIYAINLRVLRVLGALRDFFENIA